MTQKMTEQQCEAELKNILKNAVENGNFNYKVHASDKFFLWGEDKDIEIVLAEENETKEIYVDDEHTLFFDDEDTKVCKTKRNDLLLWGREYATYEYYNRRGRLIECCYDKFDFDDETDRKRKSKVSGLGGHSEVNYIITQLIVAKRLKDAQRLTLEQFIQMFGKFEYHLCLEGQDTRTEGDSYEWDVPGDNCEVYVFGTSKKASICLGFAPLAKKIVETLHENEVKDCFYFKTTHGNLVKACKRTKIPCWWEVGGWNIL